MCQSKAEGGRRCAFHLAQGVDSAMAAFASAQTGLRHQAAVAVLEDLRREAVPGEAPSRDEVDDFLRKQEMNVRFDQNLTEPKRQGILNRLRAAIGRVLPTRAQFEAWRNVVAEAWARTRKKVAVFLIAGALVGAGGCGTAPAADHSHPVASPTVATATAHPGDVRIAAPSVAKADFSGAAVDTFGQADVNAAYQQVSNFASKYSYEEKLLPESGWTAADFEGPTSQMTASAADGYRQTVQKAIAGDSDAQKALEGVSYFGISGPDATFASSGPLVVNRSISGATASVDNSTGSPRLQMTVQEHGDLRVTYKGAKSLVPMDKTVTYYMVKNDSGQGGYKWLVDGIHATWSVQTPVADTTGK